MRDWIAEQATRALAQAVADTFAAQIGFGAAGVPESATVNRHRAVGGTVNTRVHVVRFDDAGGTPRGVLFDFGSHPNLFTTSWGEGAVGKFGPGWPGYTRQWLEMTYGLRSMFARYEEGKDYYDLFTLFALGAAGDQQPCLALPGGGEGEISSRQDFVASVGGAVLEAMGRIQTSPAVRLAFRSRQVALPGDGEQAEEGHTRVSALLIDDAAIGFVPGELTADLGAWFVEGAGCEHAFLVTVADDYTGYLTSEVEALEGATYEGKGSRYGAARGRVVMNALMALVNPAAPPLEPVDPGRELGAIVGQVHHDGGGRIVVGLIGDAFPPSDLPRFWGRRVEPDSSGRFRFDRVAPWTRFLYVKEVADDYSGEAGKDGRTLLSGEEVDIRPGQETRVELWTHSGADVGPAAVRLDESSVSARDGVVSGRVDTDGPLPAGRYVSGGIYPRDAVRWAWHGSYYMAHPLQTVPVEPTGRFSFTGLSPGAYLLAFWFDRNGNGRPDAGVDPTTGYAPVGLDPR